jgi:hypothetical protein
MRLRYRGMSFEATFSSRHCFDRAAGSDTLKAVKASHSPCWERCGSRCRRKSQATELQPMGESRVSLRGQDAAIDLSLVHGTAPSRYGFLWREGQPLGRVGASLPPARPRRPELAVLWTHDETLQPARSPTRPVKRPAVRVRGVASAPDSGGEVGDYLAGVATIGRGAVPSAGRSPDRGQHAHR